MADTVQAKRLRKGQLIKVGNDLFRILELHHLTPGNLRAHVQCRMRNIRSLTLQDVKWRSEEDIERAVLDEKEILDAKWYRRDELPMIPGSISIARRLIDMWMMRG